MKEDQEEEKKDLNNDKLEINRGFELLLRNRRRKPKPKTFEVQFSFIDREIAFSLDIKKRNTLEKQSWK